MKLMAIPKYHKKVLETMNQKYPMQLSLASKISYFKMSKYLHEFFVEFLRGCMRFQGHW